MRCRKHVEELVEGGARLQMAYAWFPEPGGPPKYFIWRTKAHISRFALRVPSCRAIRSELESLAKRIPLLGWYEREMTELCGV